MKTQIWVYIVVGLLSLGAGVAIAGVPNSEAREATIQPPTTTETTLPDLDEDPADEAPADEADPADDDSEDPADTSTADTTTTTTTTTTTAPLPDRSVFAVAVANGSDTVGGASAIAEFLEATGYVDLNAIDGSVVVDETVVYAGIGLDAAAQRIAEDLGLDAESVLPLEELPEVPDLENEQLVVYLGRDLAVDL